MNDRRKYSVIRGQPSICCHRRIVSNGANRCELPVPALAGLMPSAGNRGVAALGLLDSALGDDMAALAEREKGSSNS